MRSNYLTLYLEGRSEIVRVGCVTSDELSITTGVPQGPVLRPLLLFSLYERLHYVSDSHNR